MISRDSIVVPARRAGKGEAGFGDACRKGVLRIVTVLGTWAARAEQRRQLASLDTRMLRDIGRSEADARREAAKPFWRE